MAWDVGYLTHLYFHPHLIKPTKAEWTLKVKGETVLNHVVFCCADRQVKTHRSPLSLWDLAGKALLTQLGRRKNGNLSVIEWKYQKYIGY